MQLVASKLALHTGESINAEDSGLKAIFAKLICQAPPATARALPPAQHHSQHNATHIHINRSTHPFNLYKHGHGHVDSTGVSVSLFCRLNKVMFEDAEL